MKQSQSAGLLFLLGVIVILTLVGILAAITTVGLFVAILIPSLGWVEFYQESGWVEFSIILMMLSGVVNVIGSIPKFYRDTLNLFK